MPSFQGVEIPAFNRALRKPVDLFGMDRIYFGILFCTSMALVGPTGFRYVLIDFVWAIYLIAGVWAGRFWFKKDPAGVSKLLAHIRWGVDPLRPYTSPFAKKAAGAQGGLGTIIGIIVRRSTGA